MRYLWRTVQDGIRAIPAMIENACEWDREKAELPGTCY